MRHKPNILLSSQNNSSVLYMKVYKWKIFHALPHIDSHSPCLCTCKKNKKRPKKAKKNSINENFLDRWIVAGKLLANIERALTKKRIIEFFFHPLYNSSVTAIPDRLYRYEFSINQWYLRIHKEAIEIHNE